MDDSVSDLLIHIRGSQNECYEVEATLSDGSVYSDVITLPKDERQKLLALELQPVEYGTQLFGLLFKGRIGTAYAVATGLARKQSAGRLHVRLLLDLSLPAAIHSIKWERLCQQEQGQLQPLAISEHTPLSRHSALALQEPTPLDVPYINLLVVVSSPTDLSSKGLTDIDVDAELRRLAPALRDVLVSRRCRVTILPGTRGGTLLPETLEALRLPQCEVLANGPNTLDAISEQLHEKHVLHYLGHGQFVHGAGALFLEAQDGTMAIASEDKLLARLGNSNLQLIFLAACDSARRDAPLQNDSEQTGAAELGLAAALVAAGVPAVVAMQSHVSIEGAYHLTAEFYRRLFWENGSVDLALNQARKLLYDDNDGEWATPVLYTRLRSGQLTVADPLFSALQAATTDRDYKKFRHDGPDALPLHGLIINRGQQYAEIDMREMQPTGTVMLFQAADQWLNDAVKASNFLLLLGGPGSGRSVLLRQLISKSIDDGLKWTGRDRWLPVFMGPQLLAAAGSPTAEVLEHLILDEVREIWSNLTVSTLESLPAYVRLRIFVNGGNFLPDAANDLLKQVAQLAGANSSHVFVLAIGPITVPWSHLGVNDNVNPPFVLAVRPLSRPTIRQHLERQPGFGEELLNAIEDSYLFDLASYPFALSRMIAAARRHILPISRTAFMQQMLDEAIGKLPSGDGLRTNAARTLRSLALEMHSNQSDVWPINDAFDVLLRTREHRGYDLEVMYKALVEAELLQTVGEDAICFGYRAFQEFLCAEALLETQDRDCRLAELIGTLSFAPKLRWWEETIIFVCGLLARQPEQETTRCLRRLLEPLVYGTNLLEDEAVFLAARCLVECRQHKNAWSDLVNHVVDALTWRADSSNEQQWSQRLRAIQLLARLAMPERTVQLARLAYDKVRQNIGEEPDFEFSAIRFAAATVLRRMAPEVRTARLEAINPELPALFNAWNDKHVADLLSYSKSAEDPGIQGIAALALGDLHGYLRGAEAEPPAAEQPISVHTADEVLQRLIEMFKSSDTRQAVRWPVADALSVLDLTLVTEQLIEPLFQAYARRADTDPDRPNKIRKTLAYLIGQLRMNGAQAHDFLVGECMAVKDGRPVHDWSTWGTAIGALGRSADEADAAILVELAGGSVNGVALQDLFPDLKQRTFLLHEAIAALANFAELDMLDPRVRNQLASNPALVQVFYQTVKSMYWRETLRLPTE